MASFSVAGLRLWFSLVSNLLSPPGPGPITKKDWKPLAQKHLANRKIIFHTDSAKAYKLKLPGAIHDAVVHQKKRIKLKGKWVWTKPSVVEVVSHKLPDGKHLKVKAGTQHIDRCWKFLKERLSKGPGCRAGMARLPRKIRAARHRGNDLSSCTGDLLRDYMSDIMAKP